MMGGLGRMMMMMGASSNYGWHGGSSANASWRGEDEGGGSSCSYTRVRRSECRVVEDEESGKPMRRCENTQELLRRCSGRPLEVIESVTETTEEEISKSMINSQDKLKEIPVDLDKFLSNKHHLKFSEPVPRLFDHQDEGSGIFLGGFEDFLHAAEEMASKVFEQFGVSNPYYGKGFSLPEDRLNQEHSGKVELDRSYPSENYRHGSLQKEEQFADYEKDFREI